MDVTNHTDENNITLSIQVRYWEVDSVFCPWHMTEECFWTLNYPTFILIKFIDWLISWVNKDIIIRQVIIFHGKPEEDTFY